MKPTYVLFVPGMRPPTVSHSTIEKAREEAKRLIDDCSASSVMICQFVEGLEHVTSVKAMKKNPLCDSEPIF